MLGTRVRGTAQDGRGVGGGIRAVTGLGPLPRGRHHGDHRLVPAARARGSGTPVGSSAAPAPSRSASRRGGSTFVWSERLDLPLGALGRLGWRLVRPVAGWGLRRSLRSFAAWAEHHSG